MSCTFARRVDAKRIVAAIDAVSRTRELTPNESRALEYFIKIVDGGPVPKRIPFGTNKVLAAMSIKRDMTIYPMAAVPRANSRARKLARSRFA